jgi:hypothetical protein
MRIFRATTLQDAGYIPWQSWDDTEHTRTRDEVWGVTIIPTPKYAEYDERGSGIGDPIYFEWAALLPPEYPLPDWITEVTPDTTTP